MNWRKISMQVVIRLLSTIICVSLIQMFLVLQWLFANTWVLTELNPIAATLVKFGYWTLIPIGILILFTYDLLKILVKQDHRVQRY